MWGPLPSTTTVNEPPFCGDWSQILTVSVSDATVTEGDQAAVTVTAAGSGSGSVQYRTVDGTATAGRDFRDSGPSSLTFAGPGTRQVRVDTIDDSDDEGNRVVHGATALANPSGVEIGVGTATVTITDNDGAPPCPAGQTGTPPNCVPAVPCPAGQTGTPPNCVPIVISTGCERCGHPSVGVDGLGKRLRTC